MSNQENSERNWKTLVETSPNDEGFLTNVLIEAHEVLGIFAKEDELPIARAVVNKFYDKGIVGADISRLRIFVNESPKEAYDVLTIPQKMAEFRSVCLKQNNSE